MLPVVSTATPPPAISTRWLRDLVFHLAGVATATLGLTLWLTGVCVSLCLAITYFGLVLALGTLLACRWFARVERRRAGIVLGAPIAERYPPLAAGPWTARLHALIGIRTTWRDFAWTGLSGCVAMTPGGGGLSGLRARVEALDGTLTVTSPPGGGTTVRAELPCAR